MNLKEVTLVTKDVEPGWPLIGDDVPLGKKYLVDMDRIEIGTLQNALTGREMRLACVFVIEPGPPGFLPCMAFGIEGFIALPRVEHDVTYPTLGPPFVANVCGLGRRERCCSYLCKQAEANYFCAKGTPYEGVITKKRRMGQMKATGDNCSGPPHFHHAIHNN